MSQVLSCGVKVAKSYCFRRYFRTACSETEIKEYTGKRNSSNGWVEWKVDWRCRVAVFRFASGLYPTKLKEEMNGKITSQYMFAVRVACSSFVFKGRTGICVLGLNGTLLQTGRVSWSEGEKFFIFSFHYWQFFFVYVRIILV